MTPCIVQDRTHGRAEPPPEIGYGRLVRIVLVTRQGCHLCDEALHLLEDLGIHPEVADVDADDELHRLYDFRVPVVLIDGAVVAEGRVRRDQLVAALASKLSTD
jgi:predicted thioredoxin/glutaredoxin